MSWTAGTPEAIHHVFIDGKCCCGALSVLRAERAEALPVEPTLDEAGLVEAERNFSTRSIKEEKP